MVMVDNDISKGYSISIDNEKQLITCIGPIT